MEQEENYWDHVRCGHRLYNRRKYADALAQYQRAYSLEPADIAPLYYQADCYFWLNQPARAYEILQDITSVGLEEVQRRYGRSKSWYDAVCLDALYQQARCMIELGNYPAGIALMKAHLAKRRRGLQSEYSKREVEDDLFIREVELKYGDVRPVDGARLMEPFQGHCFDTHRHRLQREGDYRHLEKYLLKKLEEFPDEYYINSCLANCYSLLGKPQREIQHAQAAYEANKHDPLCIYVLARAHMNNEQWSDAICVVDQLLGMDLREVAFGPYGEGKRWARELINDAIYIKAWALHQIGENAAATELAKIHLDHRKGIMSEFTNHRMRDLISE